MKAKRLNLIFVFVSLSFFGLFLLTISLADGWVQTMIHPKRTFATGELLKREKIPFKKVKLMTEDGIQLMAWYTPPKNGAVILVAHGYNDHRPENIYAMLTWHGYGVLAWDFRAHGDSAGEFSTLGYYEQLDVEAALDYALHQKGVDHVGAWGGSMGAATVLLTAANRPEIEAIVSDSGFASLRDVVGGLPDFMLPVINLSVKYHTGANMMQVSPVDEISKISPRAVLIIDGWSNPDTTLSFPHRLYGAAEEPKEIWVEENVSHLGMLEKFPKEYEEKVISFFDEWLLHTK